VIGEGIFNGGGEPIGYGLKIERKRIMTDKAMSNVKIQNSSEIKIQISEKILDI